LILRGLVVALSGFLFIFAPGVPMRLLARFGRSTPRQTLYWGMGVWLVSLLPSYFVLGPGSTATFGADPTTYLLTLGNALLAAVFLVGGMALFLRFKKVPDSERVEAGLTLGFGVGLIAQVFTGLSLVGAGFRLTFGDPSGPTLAGMAQSPWPDLVAGLLAMVLFRMALLTVSACVGLLVAQAISGGRRKFWLALGADVAFHWLILALQVSLGLEDPGVILVGQASLLTSAVTAAYYLVAIGLAYRWLRGQLGPDAPASDIPTEGKRRSRRAA
jgi:hypothetical protein